MTRAPTRDKTILAVAVVLAACAILLPLWQAFWGVRLMGKGFAQDGAFAAASLAQFRTELLAGSFAPRWSFTGNFGLGSPEFFFYPAAGYYVASAVSLAAPGLSDATVLSGTDALYAALSVAICAVWIGRRAGRAAGLLAGALYATMPYVAFLNPQARLAFAEMTAAPLWPLAFLAVDLCDRNLVRLAVATSAVFAAFIFTHVPSFILCAGLLPLYALAGGGDLRDALARGLACALGLVLGVLLLGFYFVPAFVLQHAIPSGVLDFGMDSALLTPRSFIGLTGKLQNFALVVPAAGALAVWRRDDWRRPERRAIYATLAVTVVLITPLATPLWMSLPPLHKVQFPWRALAPASALGAAAIGWGVVEASRLRRVLVLGSALIITASLFLGAYALRDHDRNGWARSRAAESWWNSQPREYTPQPAAKLGWLQFREHGGDYAARAKALEGPCLGGQPGRRQAQALRFDLSRCSGWTRLPLFYFPGWTATAAGRPTVLTADPATGLLLAELTPSDRVLRVQRHGLPVQRTALLLSAFGLGAWLTLLAFDLLRRRGEKLPTGRKSMVAR